MYCLFVCILRDILSINIFSKETDILAGGLVNGTIKVFNAASGSLMTVLDNEEVAQECIL
jgi:hypothetical protein